MCMSTWLQFLKILGFAGQVISNTTSSCQQDLKKNDIEQEVAQGIIIIVAYNKIEQQLEKSAQ